ncbi:DNA cytosine methyltransferase, partial [Streptococcus agalactiae]|nr:DNA cytosine methyltransferase [Streptococcus agalactiae]
QRSRGKFKPAPNLTTDEVKNVLLKKIEEETNKIIEDSSDLKLVGECDFREDKINVVSLFSGAGGLDLGTELAGLVSRIGITESFRAFEQREDFQDIREESLFHT